MYSTLGLLFLVVTETLGCFKLKRNLFFLNTGSSAHTHWASFITYENSAARQKKTNKTKLTPWGCFAHANTRLIEMNWAMKWFTHLMISWLISAGLNGLLRLWSRTNVKADGEQSGSKEQLDLRLEWGWRLFGVLWSNFYSVVPNINTRHVSAYVRADWLPHSQQTCWFTNCHLAWRQLCSCAADRFVLILTIHSRAELLSFPSFSLNLQWRDKQPTTCVINNAENNCASVILLPSAASGMQVLIYNNITAALLSHSARKPRNDGRWEESPQQQYCSFNSRVATLMHKSGLWRHHTQATFPTADQDNNYHFLFLPGHHSSQM